MTLSGMLFTRISDDRDILGKLNLKFLGWYYEVWHSQRYNSLVSCHGGTHAWGVKRLLHFFSREYLTSHMKDFRVIQSEYELPTRSTPGGEQDESWESWGIELRLFGSSTPEFDRFAWRDVTITILRKR